METELLFIPIISHSFVPFCISCKLAFTLDCAFFVFCTGSMMLAKLSFFYFIRIWHERLCDLSNKHYYLNTRMAMMDFRSDVALSFPGSGIGAGKDRVQCQLCKTRVVRRVYRRHFETMHVAQEPVSCHYCKKVFKHRWRDGVILVFRCSCWQSCF